MSASQWVFLENCTILARTNNALLVASEDLGEATWIPLSQIEEEDKFEKGDKDCTVGITTWMAKKLGLDSD